MIEPLLPVADPRHGGRPLVYDRRLVINTILYVLGSGCAWRLVPPDGPVGRGLPVVPRLGW